MMPGVDFEDVFRRVAVAWGEGDIETVVALSDPECEAYAPTAMGGGAFVGHEGLRRWRREIEEGFSRFEIELGEIRDLGDRGLALAQVTLMGKSSGIPITQPVAYLIEARGELVMRLQVFMGDLEPAIRAADTGAPIPVDVSV
jgi:hypothetical protein